MGFSIKGIASPSELREDMSRNGRAYFMALSISFGGMFFGWDTGLIGGVLGMESFQKYYRTSEDSGVNAGERANLEGNIVSTLQAGCFFGAMSAAYIAGRWGRRIALWVAGVIFIIGSVVQTCCGLANRDTALDELYVGRVIGGFGVGLVSVVVPLYISESAPTPIRGRCTATMQLLNVTGIMLAYFVNLGLTRSISPPDNPNIWRIAFALQMLPGVIFMILLIFHDESPRWLVDRGRIDEAQKVLAKLRRVPIDDPDVLQTLHEIKESFAQQSKLTLLQQFKAAGESKKIAYRVALGPILMFGQQWTGTNSINYYSPRIFKSLGMSGGDAGLFATGIYGVVKVVFTSIALASAIEQFGRKRPLIFGGLAQSYCMFFMGIYSAIRPEGSPIVPASYAAIVHVYLYVVGYSFGWGSVPWVAGTEACPNHLRALATTFALMMQWLMNFVIARITPVLLEETTFGTFLLFGATCFAMVLFAVFFMPETQGLALEQVSSVFEGSILTQSLADSPGGTFLFRRVQASRPGLLSRTSTSTSTADSIKKRDAGEVRAAPGELRTLPRLDEEPCHETGDRRGDIAV